MIKTLFISILALSLLACATQSSTPKLKQYSLIQGAETTSTSTEDHSLVLRVLPATIEAPFSNKNFIYKMTSSHYVSDPYNAFISPPNLQLSQYVLHHLQGKVNATVISSDNLVKANTILQLNVSELYADYTNPSHPTAHIQISAILYQDIDGTIKMKDQKTLSANTSTESNNPAALIEAYRADLEEVNADLVKMIDSEMKSK
jgi:ABC-type uncharacterized transport system auxiliary subunit